MNVFAITGTNGKTTVSCMLRSIIEAAGEKTGLIGTIIHEIGGEFYEVKNTTPGKALLEEYFKKYRELDIRNVIMEASSHALDQGRTDEVGITNAAFTNLSRDHLDYHNTMERYYEAKKKLFQYPSVKAVVINIDDMYGRKLNLEINSSHINKITVSMKNKESDIYASWAGQGLEGGKLILKRQEDTISLTLSAIGEYAAMDAALAAGLAYSAGIDSKYIKIGLESFSGVPGRAEIIHGEKTGATAIVDYAHTPDALENILGAAAMIANERKRRLITVFGCGGRRDKEKRKQMGVIAGEMSDICIITNDNPRDEKSEDIFAMIEDGIYGTGCAYSIIEEREEAIKKAIQSSKPGDIIVVAGKGHEKTQIFENEIRDFDDKEVIKEFL
ncbi:MAG: UDP-N-acetylmuramoyl-L-alanyl-D-glutamate--2,6-diaminopimelate ligase [Eubacteriales bacterium]|nr:UDP-N-acetylmuramoyl-L-alanyl-D-glutamate--2,6-diaminopimelate ligase [Eubacteriales bacterium]